MASVLLENSDSDSDSDSEVEPIMASKYSKDDIKEIAKDLLAEIKLHLVTELKAEFRAIVNAETAKLGDEITSLKEENKSLKLSLKSIVSDLDELEQYGRRMCLDISNIPGDTGNPNEDVETIILEHANRCNIALKPEDIDKCHRKGKYKGSGNRKVIVRFTNSKARQRVYEGRRTIGDGIFVQENLTRRRDQLAYEARQLVRTKSLMKTWVGGCRIFALIMHSGKELKIQIHDMDDIASIRQGHPPTT